jgi:hypothetical protein
MSLRVDILGDESLDLIDQVHQSSARPLVYGSARYIRFLLRALRNVRLICPVIWEGDTLIGTLPLLEQTAGDGRAVLNSLPFFGSHGGPCLLTGSRDPSKLQELLLQAANDIAETQRAISLTIVESPLQPMDATVARLLGLDIIDDRIGQFTSLPCDATNVEAALFEKYHVKTRNAVRKGQKLGQKFQRRTDQAAIDWLQSLHQESIASMGGVPKSRTVFAELLEQFPLDSHARLYIGSCNGAMASGLLVLLFGNTVEYFTPVVDGIYKDQQALSALIHHVMLEAARDGFTCWNWGGTWRSQEGVYRFKNRFGASDMPYRYFHRLLDASLKTELPSDVSTKFPYFYTFKHSS